MEKNIQINELWRISADNKFWPGDGAVYEDTYLTWGNDPSDERVLIAYDIRSQEKKWEYNFTQHYGWGQEMLIKDGFLYCDKLDLGFTVFDLSNKVAVGSVRHDDTPNFTSSEVGSFHDNKIYKSIYEPNEGLAVLLTYKLTDLSLGVAFQWLFNPELKVKFSSPAVVYNEGQQRNNLLMLLNLSNKNFMPDTVNLTLIVNVNEDYSVNWLDTLDISSGIDFNYFSPLYYGDDVFFILGRNMYSYDFISGSINWITQINGSFLSKIVIVEDEFYAILSNTTFSKFNPDTGEIIWTKSIGRAPSIIGDFELYQEKIVYSHSGFGPLIVLNNSNGEIEVEAFENPFNTNISNPKLYRKEGIFIAHSNNEIIAFEIKE